MALRKTGILALEFYCLRRGWYIQAQRGRGHFAGAGVPEDHCVFASELGGCGLAYGDFAMGPGGLAGGQDRGVYGGVGSGGFGGLRVCGRGLGAEGIEEQSALADRQGAV